MTPDVIIVGAGPAGVSAALWARSLHLVPRVFEAGGTAGGQLQLIHFHPLDLAGVTAGEGPAIAEQLTRQLRESRIDVAFGATAAALEGGGEVNPPRVIGADGSVHECGAVLVATGVRRRRLEVPGESEFEGRGVSYSATRDRAMFANRDVVVVGGGDGAFENALLLSDVGCHVTLVVRGMPRARLEFLERVSQDSGIEVLGAARVAAIRGRDWVSSVRIESGDQRMDRKADGVIIKIGVIPNTEWCAGALELDGDGYVRVDGGQRTSRPRVWAAGDVTRPVVPSLAAAIGQGALAMGAIRAVLRPA
ncbi:MAG TPA: NAD(P)/FAD-dependent oxidoreductase [Candidatus Eisenbacteria bacterium]